MRLSDRAQTLLQNASNQFVQQVADIVASDTAGMIALGLQERLAELTGGDGRVARGGARGRRPGRPAGAAAGGGARAGGKRRKIVQYDSNMLDRFVSLLREAGGTAFPGDVSSSLRLSPFQRRRLVSEAVSKGLVKTQGRRRSTKYVLVGGGAGRGGKRAAKKAA